MRLLVKHAGKKGKCSCGSTILIPLKSTSVNKRTRSLSASHISRNVPTTTSSIGQTKHVRKDDKKPQQAGGNTSGKDVQKNLEAFQIKEDTLFFPVGTSREFLVSRYYALSVTNSQLVLFDVGATWPWIFLIGGGILGFYIGKLNARCRASKMRKSRLNEKKTYVYKLSELDGLDVRPSLFGSPILVITDSGMSEEYKFNGLNQETAKILLDRFEAAKASIPPTKDPEDSEQWVLKLRPKYFWMSFFLSFPFFFFAPIGLWLAIKDYRNAAKTEGNWGLVIFEIIWASFWCLPILLMLVGLVISAIRAVV